MPLTKEMEEVLSRSVDEAVKYRHEFVTLEHLLFALLDDKSAYEILYNCGADIDALAKALQDYFKDVLEQAPVGTQVLPELTPTFQSIVQHALLQAESSGKKFADSGNILAAFYNAEHSFATYLLLPTGRYQTRYPQISFHTGYRDAMIPRTSAIPCPIMRSSVMMILPRSVPVDHKRIRSSHTLKNSWTRPVGEK